MESVFEDIRRGAPPARARDRGLSVRHLSRFFDPSIWKKFDDEEDVSTIHPAPHEKLIPSRRVFSLYTETFFSGCKLKKLFYLMTHVTLRLGTRRGHGFPLLKTPPTTAGGCFILLGYILLPQRISHGLISGIYLRLRIDVCEGNLIFCNIGILLNISA